MSDIQRLLNVPTLKSETSFPPQGEYYNADEVQAMVAAEMLEEKRKKAEEEDMFDDIGAEAGQVRRGRNQRNAELFPATFSYISANAFLLSVNLLFIITFYACFCNM